MLELTEAQQIEYSKELKRLSARGIEEGKVIELWQSPERFCVDGNNFQPEKFQDSDKRGHICFYKDQYGIIQSAILLQRHFATITKMEPANYYGIYVKIIAESNEFTFTKSSNSNGEWTRMRKDKTGYSLHYMLVEDAYNGRTLFLDGNGNRPTPEKPIVVCKDHDWAHHKNDTCCFCTGETGHISKSLLRLCNTGQVIWVNEQVPIV